MRRTMLLILLYCHFTCINGFSEDEEFPQPLMVPLTLIQGADTKEAVCLDGSLPAYHFDPGSGSGANNWLIKLEGGAWCYSISTCVIRKNNSHGSSKYMETEIGFTGILSNRAEENPDFFNWNRFKLRSCDGASFAGEGQDEVAQLHFRGQRIWSAAMDYLMEKGMKSADKALLTGCSAGGLAAILHCDEFHNLFHQSTTVKCASDAGMFLDSMDIAGRRNLREMFGAVVSLQGVEKNLPRSCTDYLDPTLCFFPQNLVADIKTPLFILNSAYDTWQIANSLVPITVDPEGHWKKCTEAPAQCNTLQIQILQDFRNQMLDAVKVVSMKKQNGLFINSCFTHCQSETTVGWFTKNSPSIRTKMIAEAFGDWYFEKEQVKAIDCPFPCDHTCII